MPPHPLPRIADIRRIRPGLLATLLLATVATALSPWYVPQWQASQERRRLANTLTSDDGAVRLAALNQLIRKAGEDDAMVAVAATACLEADHGNLVQLLNALRFAGCLDHAKVLATAGRRLVEDDPASATVIWTLLQHGGVTARAPLWESMVRHLSVTSDEEAFLRQAAWIDEAGGWREATVPASMRRHRLMLLARSKDTARRVDALTQAGTSGDLADDDTVLELVRRGGTDVEAIVRDAAITCAARLAYRSGTSDRRVAQRFAHLLSNATSNEETVLAFRAWLQLGLLRRLGLDIELPPAEPAMLPPAVAMAAVWAKEQAAGPAASTDPHDGFIGIRALARAERCDPGAVDWVQEQLAAVAARLEASSPFAEQDLLDAWRLMLALKHLQSGCGVTPSLDGVQRIGRLASQHDGLDALRPIIAYCDPTSALLRPQALSTPLERLAAVEGAAGQAFDFIPHPSDPTLLKVFAVDMAAHPDPAWLHRALRDGSPEIRQLACTVAASRFDTATLDRLIDQLLLDYDDDARRSGALLSGLTGRRTETLASRLVVEVERPMRVAMQVGLWMQARKEETPSEYFDLESHGPAYAVSGDLSFTTWGLAQIRRQTVTSTPKGHDPRAATILELFALERQEVLDLVDLLVDRRWWAVLESWTPSDVPPLQVWGDPGTVDFQIDRLVAWAHLRTAP